MGRKRSSGLVSVVVPAYNCEAFVSDCLKGLFSQSYRHMEVLVVDDGSSDRTAAAVRRFRSNLPTDRRNRLTLIRLPRNVGYAGAMTTGLYLARGEFIALNDADDVALPDRISRQVAYLRQHPRIGLVGTQYRVITQGGRKTVAHSLWLPSGDNAVRKVYAKGGHAISCGTTLFRGVYFDRLGGFRNRLAGAEDYDFIAGFVNARIPIDNLPDILHLYRQHKGQRSRRYYGHKR